MFILLLQELINTKKSVIKTEITSKEKKEVLNSDKPSSEPIELLSPTSPIKATTNNTHSTNSQIPINEEIFREEESDSLVLIRTNITYKKQILTNHHFYITDNKKSQINL